MPGRRAPATTVDGATMGRRRTGRPLHGWLVIDKPAGMTSARVVSEVLRLTGARKAGHGGTLDPIATGVLPVALGEATKTAAYAVDSLKCYRFVARWGEQRDTDDADGEITATSPGRPERADIEGALPEFTGWIEQVPPAYSAVKVAGKRAYDLARRGAPAELAARRVHVVRFDLVELHDADSASFEVECGKGAYVRALVRDLARRLGTLGHVQSLRRIRVGGFLEGDAISLDRLAELVHSAPPSEYLSPVETALADIPALALTEPQGIRLRSGQAVRVLNAEDGTVCAMAAGRPVALARIEGGELRPVRVFNM